MTPTMHDEEPFLTKDLGLAGYLLYKGMSIVSSVPNGTFRDFVFIDQPSRTELVEQWISEQGDAAVCKRYAGALRQVKRVLHED